LEKLVHIETININFAAGQSAINRAFIEAFLRGPEMNASDDQPAANGESTGVAPELPPCIGDAWPAQQGIYAGVSRGEDGAPDAHIVLLDEIPEKELKWSDAVMWAEGRGNGARLPTRFESALLYANVRDKLDTDGWYWTGTQHSVAAAFVQYFDDGYQYYDGKAFEGRARAVRRLAI